MLSRVVLLLSALALPAPLWAQEGEPVAESGYFTGCDAEGQPVYCYITAAGFNFAVAEDGPNAEGLFKGLSELPLMASVVFKGRITAMGDSSADLALSSLSVVTDDPYAATLNALQGDWQPDGEETPFQVSVLGLDWLEYVNGEMQDSFQITPGMACADGVAADGMTLSLYRYGDDPAEDACWQVVALDETTMVLRDRIGDQGDVPFTRVTGQ